MKANMRLMHPPDSRRAVSVFVGFTIAFSSIFYFLIAKSGHSGGPLVNYVGCLMWCPGLAALVTCRVLRRDLSTLGWSWGTSRYQVICYLIPLAYGSVSYAFVWLTGFGGFYNEQFVGRVSQDLGLGPMAPFLTIFLYFLFTATISVIMDVPTVLGEEIGWRGFLVPELARRHGFAATAMISGLIWALWHYPLLLLGDYHPDTPVWFYLPLFTLLVPVISFVWTWMRLKSGSIWPGVVLHAAHNTFIQRFFEPLTVYNKKTPYMAGEFGVALGAIRFSSLRFFGGGVGRLKLRGSGFAEATASRVRLRLASADKLILERAVAILANFRVRWFPRRESRRTFSPSLVASRR